VRDQTRRISGLCTADETLLYLQHDFALLPCARVRVFSSNQQLRGAE
jgi:hypothetical protein